MQAIVLAGGRGTRLQSRVSDRPKVLAPVAGRPFLEYVLDWLDDSGCRRVVLATGHLSEQVEAHFGTRYRGVALSYSRETSPLGTGGAVLKALAGLPDGPTLVMNGDTWFGLDLQDFVAWCTAREPRDAIVLRRVPDVSRFGSVTVQGEIVTQFGEKIAQGPGFINAGIYRLRRSSFASTHLPSVFSIENDFFRPHATRLGLLGYVCEGPFIDIGVPQDYDRAQLELPGWIRST
jgi:D-glycero-alpha-D-manno-heptose 1-phosphate guanylyltransferase